MLLNKSPAHSRARPRELWLLLPRPWLDVDESRVSLNENQFVYRTGRGVFVRGTIKHNGSEVVLPYWHRSTSVALVNATPM